MASETKKAKLDNGRQLEEDDSEIEQDIPFAIMFVAALVAMFKNSMAAGFARLDRRMHVAHKRFGSSESSRRRFHPPPR